MHESNFHNPVPGNYAMYYCIHCKKSFQAKVPKETILTALKKISNSGSVKCPDCKKPCGLDPKIKY